jgi:hypothetical protein
MSLQIQIAEVICTGGGGRAIGVTLNYSQLGF